MKTEAMQEEINNLYSEAFKDYSGARKFSIPHVPRISENYLDNRLVVMGQETNTWYNKTDDDLKNIFQPGLKDISKICLEDRHDRFVKDSISKYGGNFWSFNRQLYKDGILDKPMVVDDRLSHCWINLFAVESCKHKKDKAGRPTKNPALAKEIMEIQKDLLYKVIGVLQPKVIIALTGHGLDNYLNNNVFKGNPDKRPLDNMFSRDQLAEISFDDPQSQFFNIRIIRTYHPTYFMGYINGHKKLTAKLKAQEIKQSNSSYYVDTVINWLRAE